MKKTGSNQIGTVRPTDLQSEDILHFPGIIENKQQVLIADRATNSEGQAVRVSGIQVAQAQESSPTAELAERIRSGAQWSPEHSIGEQCPDLRVVSYGSGHRGFAYPWQPVDHDKWKRLSPLVQECPQRGHFLLSSHQERK